MPGAQIRMAWCGRHVRGTVRVHLDGIEQFLGSSSKSAVISTPAAGAIVELRTPVAA
jgi:hypothetical protein